MFQSVSRTALSCTTDRPPPAALGPCRDTTNRLLARRDVVAAVLEAEARGHGIDLEKHGEHVYRGRKNKSTITTCRLDVYVLFQEYVGAPRSVNMTFT